MSTSAKVRATTTAQTIDLVTLRANVAESETRAYGAKREYAEALNTCWSFDWFAIEYGDTTDEGKAVRAEQVAFYEVLKAAKHSNPSKVWGDVKRYGKEARYGAPESEGAGNPTRDLDIRIKEDSAKLYKAVHRAEDASAKALQSANELALLLKRIYGVDITK